MPDERAGRKDLALDTDWVTAVGMVLLGLFCALFAVGITWTTLTGKWRVDPPSWVLGLLIAYGLWLTVAARDRRLRLVFGLLVLGPVLHVGAWFLHASRGTEVTIAIFDRWTDVIVCVGVCFYSIVWLKRRVKYV
jgi:hypothetical protein